jgi:site-specific recombinase XerD
MKQISNPSVNELAEILMAQLLERGFAMSAVDRANLYATYLSDFMEKNGLQVYDESIGAEFLKYLSLRFSVETNGNLKLFIARVNAIVHQESFVTHVKMSEPVKLPAAFENILTDYKEHCKTKGLRSSSIRKREFCCRAFLSSLAHTEINGSIAITASAISKACLQVSHNSYFPIIRMFLKFLFEAKHIEKDYSFIIPHFKTPQPMPSVYSVQEVQQIEEKMNCNTPLGKRNYAMLLLATRLGLRTGDIVTMTFDELDFRTETIRIIQNKTGVPLELPMLPCVCNALKDYIQNYRGNSTSEYVFLSLYPPFSRLSSVAFGRYVRLAFQATEIKPGTRKIGPHAMRSSLASSMVNDGISYEVVRRTLGHTSANAIRSYAKLDVEQLKVYTLEPPKASCNFAEYLSGMRIVE